MPIALRQQSGNTVDAGRSINCSVTLSQATLPNSLVLVVASVTHPRENTAAIPSPPSGFSVVFVRKEDKQTTAVWQRTAAPSMNRTTVFANGECYTLQVRMLEFTGAAQSNAIDKVTVRGDNPVSGGGSSNPASGSTGNISQADELIFGVVSNRYATTSQFGFTGSLGQISQTLSHSGEPDHDRTRLTILGGISATIGTYALGARLSTGRDWVAALITFRGGSAGPARFTSKSQPPTIRIGDNGRCLLTAFGPIISKTQAPTVSISGSAWLGLFEKQFMLGGRDGLRIGASTRYRVESVEGLGGWEMRTSDTAFPRGDGEQRGVDLQSPRQIMFRVNFDGPPAELEQAMQRLMSYLRPRQFEDMNLWFRLPGMPLQVLQCRTTNITRELNLDQSFAIFQAFALKAADPRIYSARFRQIVVPVSGASDVVNVVSAPNDGNANAYPEIRITGAPSTTVTGIELVNITGNIAFAWQGILPPNGTLIGDMPAVVTSAPRSRITVDGQSKYGSWVAPREPFFLSPDPVAPGGVNALYLRTTPTQAGVTCTLRYRDTWAG